MRRRRRAAARTPEDERSLQMKHPATCGRWRSMRVAGDGCRSPRPRGARWRAPGRASSSSPHVFFCFAQTRVAQTGCVRNRKERRPPEVRLHCKGFEPEVFHYSAFSAFGSRGRQKRFRMKNHESRSRRSAGIAAASRLQP